MDDLDLYQSILTDPEMTSEIGGPRPARDLQEKLETIVHEVKDGRTWFSVVLPDEGEPWAGWVCIWEHEEDGERFSEMGWMTIPQLQGRGLATAAVQELLERARSERKRGEIRAYPAITNAASNAICRKAGFTLVGQKKLGRESVLLSNDWRIDPSDSF